MIDHKPAHGQHNPAECASLIAVMRRLATTPSGPCPKCSCFECADCDCSLEHAERDRYRQAADQLEAAQARIADLEEGVAEGVRHVSAGAIAVDTITAERDKSRLQLEARDATIAACARSIRTYDASLEELRRQHGRDRDKLQAEIDAARPVVEAAERVRDYQGDPKAFSNVGWELERAVDAYRAARDKAGDLTWAYCLGLFGLPGLGWGRQ